MILHGKMLLLPHLAVGFASMDLPRCYRLKTLWKGTEFETGIFPPDHPSGQIYRQALEPAATFRRCEREAKLLGSLRWFLCIFICLSIYIWNLKNKATKFKVWILKRLVSLQLFRTYLNWICMQVCKIIAQITGVCTCMPPNLQDEKCPLQSQLSVYMTNLPGFKSQKWAVVCTDRWRGVMVTGGHRG